jgi:site-specific DNA recombinase
MGVGMAKRAVGFGVGPLAHLLKNRFYIGEVNYRDEVYRGEHKPILNRDWFEAVQEKLAGNAVERQVRLGGSAALLAGRLFDDRGNRSPTHANKKGVRYRYYVSQPLLQHRRRKPAASPACRQRSRASFVLGCAGSLRRWVEKSLRTY